MFFEKITYPSAKNPPLKKEPNCSVVPDDRTYYINPSNQSTTLLPPIDEWDAGDPCLPYGWEIACDSVGKNYYINHINKTTTYEDPRKVDHYEPPEPREVELVKEPESDFGFILGSENPVVIRSVREKGPGEGKLLAEDKVLKVNGVDVSELPRDQVMDMISAGDSVKLTVCQPNSSRSSAILTAAKKAKAHSSRVRFADGITIKGFFPFQMVNAANELIPIPHILKVQTEIGVTKIYRFGRSITVQNFVDSLTKKLDLRSPECYALCAEVYNNAYEPKRISILDPKELVSKIVIRLRRVKKLRYMLRLTFLPKNIKTFIDYDPKSYEYYYTQCVNDLILDRFPLDLYKEPFVVFRLCALRVYVHALENKLINKRGKVKMKNIEYFYGLPPFVPKSYVETMSLSSIRTGLKRHIPKYRGRFLKTQKRLTEEEVKTKFLVTINYTTWYGSRFFPLNNRIKPNQRLWLLISPLYGICHYYYGFRVNVKSLGLIEDVTGMHFHKEEDGNFTVKIKLNGPIEEPPLIFNLNSCDTEQLYLTIKYYHQIFTEEEKEIKQIHTYWNAGPKWWTASAPRYYGPHMVRVAPWSYPKANPNELRAVDFSKPLKSSSLDDNGYESNRDEYDHQTFKPISAAASISSLETEPEESGRDDRTDNPSD
ncbi:FERM and PDZ domain-containing protein 4-like isoform X2 [Panonychus citri]|uniref:FERM and PDZ domain-containing protein 4-like isoform X2 n=1 Tax=Panonychus citri TaxID=50023 RepID=UPI0023075975|nr:FERM and PDZ domain-containing protein 4-like isoform X2 [Panonychus citri]